MRRRRSEIGMRNGVKYLLIFDKRKNLQACDPQYANEWRWFLTVADEYVGDYRLKREAYEELEKETK